MSQLNLQSILEDARSLPTELSIQDVNKIIVALPTSAYLPWYKKFNLNSIIMTTTAITIATSLALYFGNTNQIAQDLSLQQPVIIYSNEPLELISPNDRSFQITLFDYGQNELPRNSKVPLPLLDKEPTPAVSASNSNEETTEALSNSVVHIPANRKWLYTNEAEIRSLDLSTFQLQSLKNKLNSWAETDGFLWGKSDRIILEYHPKFLKINNKELENDQLQKYQALLTSYRIEPTENRKLVQDKDYIMVGDFDANGFTGIALGKAMQIDFPFQKTEINLIRKDKNGALDFETKKAGITSFSPIKEPDYKEATFIDLKRPAKQSSNLYSKVFLPESKEDHGLLFKVDDSEKEIDTGRKGVQIYTNRNESDYIHLNGASLRRLKRSLTKQLIKDKLISSEDENVRFNLNPKGIMLNDQRIEKSRENNYLSLLEAHGIELAKSNKILLSKNFIIAGTFFESEFNGSVYGTIETKNIESSIFEEDFKSLTFFGF